MAVFYVGLLEDRALRKLAPSSRKVRNKRFRVSGSRFLAVFNRAGMASTSSPREDALVVVRMS